jgi:hypothetical protein
MDTLGLFVIAGILLYLASGSTALSNILPTDTSGNVPSGGLPSGPMNPVDIATLARNAGFAGSDLITSVAVALAESGGVPNIIGHLGTGNDYGLWQINDHYHPEFGPNFSALLDPQTNANAAFSVYSAAGSTFQPWRTYTQGQYQQFLPQVQTALGA